MCLFFFSSSVSSAVVMDYDELSKDDLIGGTMINLYEVIHAGSHEICIKRLLDDRSVSVYMARFLHWLLYL